MSLRSPLLRASSLEMLLASRLEKVHTKTVMNDVGHDHVVRALSIKESEANQVECMVALPVCRRQDYYDTFIMLRVSGLKTCLKALTKMLNN